MIYTKVIFYSDFTEIIDAFTKANISSHYATRHSDKYEQMMLNHNYFYIYFDEINVYKEPRSLVGGNMHYKNFHTTSGKPTEYFGMQDAIEVSNEQFLAEIALVHLEKKLTKTT